jgi:hypothetical protein
MSASPSVELARRGTYLEIAVTIGLFIAGTVFGALMIWWERYREIQRLASSFLDQKLLGEDARVGAKRLADQVEHWRSQAEQASNACATARANAERANQLERDLNEANKTIIKLNSDLASNEASRKE